MKIYSYRAGKTLDHEKTFLQKLTKKGAKVVNSGEKHDVTIVFCPIVTRFETDIQSALTSVSDEKFQRVILVAMHHTLDKNYILPHHKDPDNRAVTLFVDCLFHEQQGLHRCPTNTKAIREVRQELGLTGISSMLLNARRHRHKKSQTTKITPDKSN